MPVNNIEIRDIAARLAESVWELSSDDARRKILVLAGMDERLSNESKLFRVYIECKENEKGCRITSCVLGMIGSTLALTSSCSDSTQLLACVVLGMPLSTINEIMVHIQQRSVLKLCEDLGISEKNVQG